LVENRKRIPRRSIVAGVEQLREVVDTVVALCSSVAVIFLHGQMLLLLLLFLLLTLLLSLCIHLGPVRFHDARCRLRRLL